MTKFIVNQKLFRSNFPCQAKVVQEAYSVCSDLNNIFLDIFEGSETHSVTYSNAAQLPNNANANAITAYPPVISTNSNGFNHYNFNIIIRDSYLSTATDLSLARTVIHENLHAVLLYLQFSGFIDPSVQNPSYQQLLYAYIDQLIISGILPPSGTAHHNFMTQFVANIKETLKEFGISKGYNLPDAYYNAMAWGGLHTTSAFQALYPEYDNLGNPNPDYDYIIGTLIAEQNNTGAADNLGNPILYNGSQIMPLGSSTSPCP